MKPSHLEASSRGNAGPLVHSVLNKGRFFFSSSLRTAVVLICTLRQQVLMTLLLRVCFHNTDREDETRWFTPQAAQERSFLRIFLQPFLEEKLAKGFKFRFACVPIRLPASRVHGYSPSDFTSLLKSSWFFLPVYMPHIFYLRGLNFWILFFLDCDFHIPDFIYLFFPLQHLLSN